MIEFNTDFLWRSVDFWRKCGSTTWGSGCSSCWSGCDCLATGVRTVSGHMLGLSAPRHVCGLCLQGSFQVICIYLSPISPKPHTILILTFLKLFFYLFIKPFYFTLAFSWTFSIIFLFSIRIHPNVPNVISLVSLMFVFVFLSLKLVLHVRTIFRDSHPSWALVSFSLAWYMYISMCISICPCLYLCYLNLEFCFPKTLVQWTHSQFCFSASSWLQRGIALSTGIPLLCISSQSLPLA